MPVKHLRALVSERNTWVIHSPHGGADDISRVPPTCIFATLLIITNAVLMAIADIVLEVIISQNILSFKIPFRMEFLVLTLVSAVLGMNAFLGLKRRELDATSNSIRVSLLVEVGLVVSDIVFIIDNIDDWANILPLRLPFILLTTINVILVMYIPLRLGITAAVFIPGFSENTTQVVVKPKSVYRSRKDRKLNVQRLPIEV